MKLPVVIVGGGIGGLALAACLQHRGIDFVVYERAPELKEVGAAIGVWPNATRVLKQLGVLPALAVTAHVARAGALRDWRGRVLKDLIVPESDVPGVAAHRADLLGCLLSAVPGEKIVLNKACVGVEEEGERVRARFADGTFSEWTEALVGADGINSAVREATLDDGPATYQGYIAWRGVAVMGEGSGATCAEQPCVSTQGYAMAIGESWGPGQRFGVVPLGKGRVGWWATANRKATEAMRGTPAEWKREILERYGGWHSPIPAVVGATEEGAVLCSPIADRDPLGPGESWGNAHVTLLGDAAHPTTPNLGQGACMAIEDAAVLAHALAAIPDVGAAFRTYEATRAKRVGFIVRESRKFGRVGQWENSLGCWLRDAATRFAPSGRLKAQFEGLWGYDAWNEPLVMPW